MGCLLVVTRSLKHMAKSVNVATVNASSRDPSAPVTRASVFLMASRSAGMRRGASRPSRRARASRAGLGSQPKAAASR